MVIWKWCKFSTSWLGLARGNFGWRLKKNQIQGVCCTTINNLTLRVYLLLRHSFLKSEFKKRIALICFIEITSILAHAKTHLNQAVKGPPHLTLLKEEASNFLLFFSSIMLKNFSSYLT